MLSEACFAIGAAGFGHDVAFDWRVVWLYFDIGQKGNAGPEDDLDWTAKDARFRPSVESIRTRSEGKRCVKEQAQRGNMSKTR